jgi:hypothetical protein
MITPTKSTKQKQKQQQQQQQQQQNNRKTKKLFTPLQEERALSPGRRWRTWVS